MTVDLVELVLVTTAIGILGMIVLLVAVACSMRDR